nr:MAG TPA: hypothetical protein [Bacteriophage sp.]
MREEIFPGLFCMSNEESSCHACMSRHLTNVAIMRKFVSSAWKEV